jgi:hypothetical protein
MGPGIPIDPARTRNLVADVTGDEDVGAESADA